MTYLFSTHNNDTVSCLTGDIIVYVHASFALLACALYLTKKNAAKFSIFIFDVFEKKTKKNSVDISPHSCKFNTRIPRNAVSRLPALFFS